MSIRVLTGALALCLLAPAAGLAQSVPAFSNPIANIPGKTLAAVVVNYAPGGKTPGAHHTISENASATEPAKVIAIFVVDTKDTPLTIPDPR